MCYWKENICKKIEIPWLQVGLFSIPFNILPWHPPRKPTRTTTVQSRNTSTTPRSSSVPALGPPNGFSDKTKVGKIALIFYFVLQVSHMEMDFMNWLWRIKICKLDWVWRWFWNTEIGNFWVPQPFFKKVTWDGLNSLWKKRC